MKVFLSCGDVTAELKVDGPYQPDVLQDICHRACEMVIQQRTVGELLEVTEDPDSSG